MLKRFKCWIQDVFVEAWETYESTHHNAIRCNRDPNQYDLYRYRFGTEWTNAKTGKVFILKPSWELKNEHAEVE